MPRVSLSRIAQTWGKLDFVVQPIALPEVALCKHAAGAPRERFLATMKIPVWPFIRMARLAEPLMPDEGSPTLYVLISAPLPHQRLGRQTRTYQRAMYSPPLQYTAFNIINGLE
jgi:hypothetical protein